MYCGNWGDRCANDGDWLETLASDEHRCENCNAIVTLAQIERIAKKGQCST